MSFVPHLFIVFILLATNISPITPVSHNIIIDCTRVNGKIISYSQINCGPLNGVNLTQQYRQIGINFVRTHDFFGPTDVSTIFPDWNADPGEEKNYNFEESDRIISSIINAGCRVFYRLGESASTNKSLREPPENFSKWAEVCKHIVMHYNDGWADGYHYNITYWEIWNEPDLKGFWNGTAQEYYELYAITAKTLKAYNSSLKVGGPCTSSIANENFTTGFLEYVSQNNIPLDFFSWHMYTNSVQEIYNASIYIRKLLDRYMPDCENVLTEWNINILTPQRDKDNAKNAAFTASCMMAFQDAGLDYAFRYRGTQEKGWLLRLLGFDLSLFTYEGEYKTPALSYLAMHYFEDTPIRLECDGCLAGISEDKTNISILLSNYDSPGFYYTLNVTNLPWKNYRAVHYLIDDSHHLEIIEDMECNESYTTTKFLKRNSVHFIRLTNSTHIPEEGPPVAKIPFWLKTPLLDNILRFIGYLLLMWIFG